MNSLLKHQNVVRITSVGNKTALVGRNDFWKMLNRAIGAKMANTGRVLAFRNKGEQSFINILNKGGIIENIKNKAMNRRTNNIPLRLKEKSMETIGPRRF